jgi:hypothetical protein
MTIIIRGYEWLRHDNRAASTLHPAMDEPAFAATAPLPDLRAYSTAACAQSTTGMAKRARTTKGTRRRVITTASGEIVSHFPVTAGGQLAREGVRFHYVRPRGKRSDSASRPEAGFRTVILVRAHWHNEGGAVNHDLGAPDNRQRSRYRSRNNARHRPRGSSDRWTMTATWRESDAVSRQPPVSRTAMLSLATSTAPASCKRFTTAASSLGTRFLNGSAPYVVGIPAVSSRSLPPQGIPCNGPRYLPAPTSVRSSQNTRARRGIPTHR